MNRNKLILHYTTIIALIKTLCNWWEPFLFALGLRRSGVRINFRDGDYITVSAFDWRAIPSVARLKAKCAIRVSEEAEKIHVVFPSGVVFELVRQGIFWQLGSLNEVFDWDDYKLSGRDLTNKVVVDVGGFIGDSALNYAMRGAVVHVFEPMPNSIAAIKRNLELSGEIGSRVKLHEVGLASQKCTQDIYYNPEKGSFCSTAGMFGSDDNVERASVTLVKADEYLEQAGISHVDILKIDCEGCEYELLNGTDIISVLSPREIAIEYHSGSKELEVRLLEKGYRVSIDGGAEVGLIFAVI